MSRDELDVDRVNAVVAIEKMRHDYFIPPQAGGYFGALDPKIERPAPLSTERTDQ